MKKILVIDDEEVIRNLAYEVLKIFGYDCILAEDGKIGVRLALEHRPDLILCDLFMPGMSGEAVLEAVKKELPELKIVMTTGKALDYDEAERINAKGALDVFHKPFTLNELRDNIDKYLS